MSSFQFNVPYPGTMSDTYSGVWNFNNRPSDLSNYNGYYFNFISDKPILNQGNLSVIFIQGPPNYYDCGIINPSTSSLIGQAVTITFLEPKPFQYGQLYFQSAGLCFPLFKSIPFKDGTTLSYSLNGGPFINGVLNLNTTDDSPYILVIYNRYADQGTIQINPPLSFGINWFFSP